MSRPLVQYSDLKQIDYKEAWDLQTQLFDAARDRKVANRTLEENSKNIIEHRLLLCEHNHVYTLGKSGSEDNLLITESERAEKKVSFFKVNRGGDITYHGPGQITGYIIFDLDEFFLDIHRFVRTIEQAAIDCLAEYDIEGTRIEGLSGVWLPPSESKPWRKICAVGIHLSRWVTMHGFALNVNTDLDMFKNIIPCGIVDEDKSVASLASELKRDMNMNEVKEKILYHLSSNFQFDIQILDRPS